MPIRTMTENDINSVLAIQNELGFQSWNYNIFLSELNATYSLSLVYEENSNVIGYAVFHLLKADSELLTIAIKKSFQHKGIATQLLREGLSHLSTEDACFLEVNEKNLKAINFYKKNGFVQYSMRTSYYSTGENALLFKWSSI